jgi:hypothetical protein
MSYNNGNNNNLALARHIAEFIGETVIIFTTSGGQSGSGFTGVILAVNCDFVRLVTSQGSAPTIPMNPFEDDDNDDFENNGISDDDYYGNNSRNCRRDRDNDRCNTKVGAVADIPIDRIVAFVHNAI